MMNTININKVWRLVTSFLLFYLFTFLPFPVAAQKLVVEQITVDAGRTGYEHPITAVFKCRNKSGKKLRISQVKPDCYCVAADYPKGDIGGNEQFQIQLTYNARQLGHFNQQAAIISNASSKPLYVTMKGIVLEHYVDLSANYPVAMGDLRLDKHDLEFDDVNRGDQPVQELHLYNYGTQDYQPNLLHLPPYLTALMQPEKLAPGEEGVMTVRLNSAKLHDYGLTQTSVYLAGNVGDKVSADHEIGVSAVLLPSFPEQVSNPAHIQLSKETVDILFEGKSKKTDVIDIVNTGQSELQISSLQMFTSGLKISLNKSRLQPGESAKLKITAYRNDLLKVRTRPRILMITNDPQKSKVTITINAK
jgi:hypothetical protein